MFISKRVYSPIFKIPGNTVDRTAGFYGHLPKFWNCRTRDWTYKGIKSFDGDDFIVHMNEVYAEEKERHAKCRIPWHLSLNGYLCFILPRRGRIMWNYFGKSPNPTHGRIVWQPNYNRKFEG